ncbi:MAG: alpha/beta hydrolase family protein, partial [Stellaceae bacterium]
ASLLWSAARWPIFENNEKSIHYNARTVACYDKYAKYATLPVERIEVPFGRGRPLPGYLHLPHKPRAGERFPCVISLDGMDGSKEILCAIYGDKFLERGFANFIYDGPGQGECTVSELFITPTNHAEAARAVFDRLARHPHIDPERVVITGVSFGSFFALQAAAALGNRLKGAAVSMVCHEPGGHAIMNMASPSFKMRFMYMAGIEDERRFDAYMQKFTLVPQAARIKCPVLIEAGEDDELSPIEFSHALVRRIRAPKKFVVYEGERHGMGGGSAAQLGENWFTLLVDWCLDRVNGKPAPNEQVFITAQGQAQVTPYR